MAITLVQKTSAVHAANSVSATFASPVTAGNLLVALVTLTEFSANPNNIGDTITDTALNTWNPALFSQSTPSDYTGYDLQYAIANATGSLTINVTNAPFGDGLGVMSLIIAEYSGVNTVTPIDTSNTPFPNPGGVSIATGNITTAASGELIIAVAQDSGHSGTPPTWAVTNGFTIEQTASSSPGYTAFADLISGAAGVYSTTFSGIPINDTLCAGIIAFNPAPPPNPVASCNTPPNGSAGTSYTHTFTASGGTPPYTFSISAGALPPGLTLTTTTGVVSGVPTTGGTYSFTVLVTDSLLNTGTVACSITINPAPPASPYKISTLRFEIPKKRWFPHSYADTIVTHYLDEMYVGSNNKQQLLMLSSANGFIYISGGDTDVQDGTHLTQPVTSIVTTPSMDGGDDRIQKLYVDVMNDADGTGSVTSYAQFNNQTINGPNVTFSPAGARAQFLQNISFLSALNLYRNVSLQHQWTGGPDGPRLYITEVAGYAQPYISTFFVTQFINLAFPGWKHHRRLYAGYISNNAILFTIKTQDGRTFGSYTLPSTGGQFKIVPLMLDQNIKDLAFAYQIDGSGNNFVLFPESWSIETKEWTQPSYLPLAIFKT